MPVPRSISDDLDRNLLRVFDVLSREGSLTATAACLGISQPAVSASLSRLRTIFDDELFTRSRRGVVPTTFAISLIGPVREALNRVDSLLRIGREFDPTTASRAFTIMGADYFPLLLAPGLAARIGTDMPGIAIRFVDNALGNAADLLADGRVSLALNVHEGVQSPIRSTHLREEDMCLVAAADNRILADSGLADKQVMPLDLYCRLPHAMRSNQGAGEGPVDMALADLGQSRRLIMTFPSFTTLCDAVSQSHMIGAVPLSFLPFAVARFGLRHFGIPSELPSLRHPLMMYWHSRNDSDQGHMWLRQLVRELSDTANLERRRWRCATCYAAGSVPDRRLSA